MESQFRQPKQIVNVEVNKQSIARNFGIGDNEVCYAKPGQPLTGYKAIYDKTYQRAYSLPTGLTGTVVAITQSGVLTSTSGTVDLGALAVVRGEFVTLQGSFTTGATVNAKNEVLLDGTTMYRWDGLLPKVVSANSTPGSTGGIGSGAWLLAGDGALRAELISPIGAPLVDPRKVSYLPDFTGAVLRNMLRKLSDNVHLKDYATGDGVTDDYAKIMECYEWAAANGKCIIADPGKYKHSQKLLFDKPEVFIFGCGMKSTSFQFTGIGIAVEFSDANPNNGQFAFTGGLSDLEIVGNANTTILLFNNNVNHWTCSRVNVREASPINGIGLKIVGPTGCHIEHFVCSTNAQLMVNRPYIGIQMSEHPITGGRTACTTLLHPIIEGMSGDGVYLTGCDQLTWVGGTSENNDGNGVTFSDAGQPRINTLIGVGFESNRGYADIYDAGQMNRFINCTSLDKTYFGVTSLFAEMSGGYHQDIIIEGEFTTVHDLKYSFFGAGGVFQPKENTKYSNIFNAHTGAIVNLPKPGHLVVLGPSPYMFTNTYGFPVDIMMDADSAATVTSVYFCEGTDPNVKVDASGSIRLDPGNSLRITYTGTPTFYWMPRS
jgi:hypothetical protein